MQNLQDLPISNNCNLGRFEYKKSYYTEMHEVLQSLRNNEYFCDIKLETDDGTKIFGHKVILASASPYFHAMFTYFSEKNKDLVVIKEISSTILQLLVDFIYSGKIMVTESNVKDLLPASDRLQMDDLKEVCCEFLQKQLCFTNCLGINALADLLSCTKLLASSKLYIQQNFLKVVESDEFLSLSSEQVVKLISDDEITVPSEEKVFECVIRWVKHELDSRKLILPQLMEHVRLPLISKNYIDSKVVKEPLLNDCPKCKDYIKEALDFHLHESDRLIFANPKNIRTKPRLGDKVILVIGGILRGSTNANSTEWYDPKTNRWNFGPKKIPRCFEAGLTVSNNNFVFAIGGQSNETTIVQSVEVLNLFSESPCWKPTVDMLVKRVQLGVGVINNYVYAVGGCNDDTNSLSCAEVFDCSTEEWRMISSMSTGRAYLGVGVLNNLLYAVGGFDYSSGKTLNSVECYHPSTDTWTPVAKMRVRRYGASVGVLDGVLYVVGGSNGSKYHKSVEAYRPNSGVWTTVAKTNFSRLNAGVVPFNGLLYVIGGYSKKTIHDSVECYNPISNTWSMLEASMNLPRHFAGVVVIDRPPCFNTC